MIKNTPEVSNTEYLEAFIFKSYQERIPLDGSFEITHRCNLRCVHCYLGDQDQIRTHRKQELSTVEIKKILRQLAAAGTLNLTLTGGDPMMRKDFAEIYTYAIKLGLIITVFCDGVLVTDKIIELFRRFPPRDVEITLYGATQATYEQVTQIPGSYRRCLEGIQRLYDNNVRFRLKSVLLNINKHEFNHMEQMAEELGVSFHYDSAIFPCLPHDDNGGQSNARPQEVTIDASSIKKLDLSGPTDYRVEPREVAAIDLADEEKRNSWIEYSSHQHGVEKSNPMLYTCGAGKTNFHIDPYGKLLPCILSTRYSYDLRTGDFTDGWLGSVNEVNQRVASKDYECNSCDLRSVCLGCPAMFDLESGAPDVKSSYICQTTHERYAGLRHLLQPDKGSSQ